MFMIALYFAGSVNAQIPLGEWRTHLPYYFCNLVMTTDEYVYCSSTSGLFSYGRLDNSLSPVTRADGLSDNVVSTMASDQENGVSLFCYDNSNLDILKENQIINIPDIFKKQITGDKTIYNIYFLDGKAYLACGFGIVVVDLQRYEIVETYFIGDNGDALRVNQVTSDGTWFYAATEQGIKRAPVDDPFLVDFNSWERIPDLPDPFAPYRAVVLFDGHLLAHYDDPSDLQDRLYIYDGAWQLFAPVEMDTYYEIRLSGNHLMLSGSDGVWVLDTGFNVVRQYTEGNPRSATLDDEGILWVADFGRGLIELNGSSEEVIRPNGPYTSLTYDIEASGNKVYAVPGGISISFNNLFRNGMLLSFVDNRWRSNIDYSLKDLVSIAVDPQDDTHVFAASWGYGLSEYRDNEKVMQYDETNSSLQNFDPSSNVIRIGGIAFDNQNNLWMTNTAVSNPVSVRKSDGSWKSFGVNDLLSGYSALGEVLVTQSGHLWGILPRGSGLFAMDFNGTIDNEEDDTYKLVNVLDENGGLITNEVYSFAEDLNGNIWLGTNQGILVFYSPSSLFTDGSIFAREIIVPRNDGTNFGDPLLQTQQITCIEVDGANRKWIGTASGGAFLVSENGLEQIHSFNTSNSPILSNSITDICVDGVSGEVFFGTDKGVISFRGESTTGASDYSGVSVFPNPVREDYHGPVAITGLMEETTVKITDVSGNLVFETESFGGTAVWDGKNFHGERVATGTYLVFLANRQPTDAYVTKILFIH
jgi:hypothetical protein